MLEGVIQQGTATKALVLNRPLAGKTGTTNEYRSAWFVGYTPDLVAGVFIGFDDNRSLGNGETGGAAALPVFIDFMQQALGDSPGKLFMPPEVAQMVMVAGQPEAFRPGTQPGGAGALTPTPLGAPVRSGPRPPRPATPPGGSDAVGLPPGAPRGAPGTPARPQPTPPPPQQVPEDLSGLY